MPTLAFTRNVPGCTIGGSPIAPLVFAANLPVISLALSHRERVLGSYTFDEIGTKQLDDATITDPLTFDSVVDL